ncbi:MAG: outer membrane lipoprotein carrier protein LolA [Flavobacteriales bacterium]|nr:outer membrane lipoprotein carrier protein LolA [Flavobacteriales bacterium]
MKKITTLLFAGLLAFNITAQEDVKAKEILDKLSAKTKSYSTIKADFQYSMVNKADGLNETQSGKIEIKGNSYLLTIQGQDIISDGKTIWTHIKESEEVQINSVSEDDEEGISPNKIFTMYETGFKYKYVDEKNSIQTINLYPKDPESKAFHRISLSVDKVKQQITEVTIFGKDGTQTIYKIKSFTPNATIADTHFTFDKNKHPNVEIIDLRD